MDYRNYRGIVFGFPEKENTEFHLEFSSFREDNLKAVHNTNDGLDSLRKSISDTRFHSYTGDLTEIFEFFLESNYFNQKLDSQGLTYTSGLIYSFGNNLEDTTKSLVWSEEIERLLTYVKENYFICSEQFLSDEGFSKMYELFTKEYETIDTTNLTLEQELEAVDSLKKLIESRVLTEIK